MRFLSSSTLLILTCLISGCGDGPTAPTGPQSQVSGTVTNDGKPVTLNSQIVFFNSEKGLTLTGTLDSLGKYSLTPADPKLGVPAGRYEVCIKPPVVPVMQVDPSSPDYAKMMQAGNIPAPAATTADIPEKFNDPKTSGLIFEVKEGPNTYDFDLAKL